MLAKMTTKNQLTIPKAALQQLPKTEYFDVKVEGGALVLQPAEVRPLGAGAKRPRALPAQVQHVLDAFVARVRQHYGQRLVHILLYGSYARGEARQDSDVDVLVVLKDTPTDTFSEERRQLHAISYGLTFDQGVPLLLSALPMDAARYAAQDSPLAINVCREAIPLT